MRQRYGRGRAEQLPWARIAQAMRYAKIPVPASGSSECFRIIRWLHLRIANYFCTPIEQNYHGDEPHIYHD